MMWHWKASVRRVSNQDVNAITDPAEATPQYNYAASYLCKVITKQLSDIDNPQSMGQITV
jgi:hypothetical protein